LAIDINKSAGLLAGKKKAEFVMRATSLLAISLGLICGTFSSAYAVSSDDLRGSVAEDVLSDTAKTPDADARQQTEAQPQREDTQPQSPQNNDSDATNAAVTTPAAGDPDHQQTAMPAGDATKAAQPTLDPSAEPAANTPAPATSAPAPIEAASPTPPAASASSKPAVIATNDLVYVPVARYLDNNRKALGNFNDADRQALRQFYGNRMGATLWVDKNGYNKDAKSLMRAFHDANNWGLNTADYKVPDLQPNKGSEADLDALTVAEVKLSLAALKYARDARGDRINDPSALLSSYLDRKPQLLNPQTVIETLATTADKGAYLESLNPKQPQFELLRQKLIALRTSAEEKASLKIPDGPNLTPGKSHPQIALIRKVLKVASPSVKADGSPADDTYYDDALARAVQAYKESKGIKPATATITMTLRRALNEVNDVSEAKIIANMEEWRWMPEDLGAFYVDVNIPEFTVRVVKNGDVIFEERIVSGRNQTQTPIFSSPMRTIVLQPRWNVPDSIKIKELLPGLRAGGDPLRRQGLVMERNGRRISAWDVDWYRADIRNFNIYQPPGGGNALGAVKFLFPNKHAVYLHDTPSKGLFNERVRMFSHGCMRVRNPIKLAEILLQEDKGWSESKVDGLIENGPEENEIGLTQPIPVHVTYFTASVSKDGEVQAFNDVYGHEKRITLALQGRWNEIEKNDEKVVSPEDYPMASDDDGDYRRSRRDYDYAYDDDDYGPRRRHHQGGFGNFFQQVFGGF
jgi:murein L,D-transpeptidase YcbB/YkuD